MSSLGITTVLTIVSNVNSIRSAAPQAKSLRSLDFYLIGCMIFVFLALVEVAVVGMTDFRLAERYKRELWGKSMRKNLKISNAVAPAEEVKESETIEVKEVY